MTFYDNSRDKMKFYTVLISQLYFSSQSKSITTPSAEEIDKTSEECFKLN